MMVPVECYIFFFFFEPYSVLLSAFFSAALSPLLSLLVCGQEISVVTHDLDGKKRERTNMLVL